MNLSSLLAGQIASQVTGYETYTADFDYNNLKKITYVTAANGLFRVEKTPVALFRTKIAETKVKIPGLLPMEDGPLLLIPKIPFKLLQQTLSFYLDVYEKDKTEASLLFFWNKDNKTMPEKYSDGNDIKGLMVEGQFIVYVPQQENSGGLSEFHKDPMVNWLRENTAGLCETHSHHVMGAFWSPTDNANENATQFYGVWGKIQDKEPKFLFRYCAGDAKVNICPSVLFEWPKVYTKTTVEVFSDVPGFTAQQSENVKEDIFKGPFPKLEYPADWMSQHTAKRIFPAIGAPNYRYGWGGKGKGKVTQDGYQQGSLFGATFPETYYEDEIHERVAGTYGFPFDYTPKGGMMQAEVQQFHKLSDEKEAEAIEAQLVDLGLEYNQLGYDKVIESSIDAVKQNRR